MITLKPKNKEELDAILEKYEKVLFQFSADWCRPCKRITPLVKDYVEKIDNDKIVYCYIDIDKLEEFSSSRSISSIPTFIVYDGNYKDPVVSSNIEVVQEYCKNNLV